MTPLSAAVLLASLATAASADPLGDLDGMTSMKARWASGSQSGAVIAPTVGSAPSSAPTPVASPAERALKPRSDVAKYLTQMQDTRVFYPISYYLAREDDAGKLQEDVALAISAYKQQRNQPVTFDDDQDFASQDFFMRTGTAKFNPNSRTQTQALQTRLEAIFRDEATQGKALQVDLIYEAIVAANGNVTLAMGSLAELFCGHRGYVVHVADMSDDNGKNYYRFAGYYAGLHKLAVRTAAEAACVANILGNGPIYATSELYDWWKHFFTTGEYKAINTARTMSPKERGDAAHKLPEFYKGFNAAAKTRAEHAGSF